MINSTSTLDFSACTENTINNNNNNKVSTKSELSAPGHTSREQVVHPLYRMQIPKNDAKTYTIFSGALSSSEYARFSVTKAKEIPEPGQRVNLTPLNSSERVRVQHHESHSPLQSNAQQPCVFLSLSAEAEMATVTETDVPKRTSNTNINNNNNTIIIHNESAFSNIDKSRNSTNNNNNNTNNNIVSINTANDSGRTALFVQRTAGMPIHRTEDQENAFRRIEDVHNYAKLRVSSCSNGSSNSSIHEDEEEDEDDNDSEIEVRTNLAKDEFRQGLLVPNASSQLSAIHNEEQKHENDESDIHIDVESIQNDEQYGAILQVPTFNTTPDHHARRPMNAFLIFCKRHRAIVKAKYKSLENRAITKILGDWWASLEPNDKNCFTNLAEKNKAAFFTANPNFKWYKLPAPSLRTLVTRPNNVERGAQEVDQRELQEDAINRNKMRADSFFKLADEAQMGELSALINEKSKVNQGELQQVLSETTEFLSTHMPQSSLLQEQGSEGAHKRKLHSEHSFSSSTSSEDDIGNRKTTRTCKGKIYQELKNSGQIAVTAKKAKTASKVFNSAQTELSACDYAIGGQQPQGNRPLSLFLGGKGSQNSVVLCSNGYTKQRFFSESDSQCYEAGSFDLEQKIRELPALSLDAYLQRKRNTKQKRKFSSSKKRNSNSTSSCKSLPASPPVTAITIPQQMRPQQAVAAAQVAVGSQKRKARKESITRRDISAIESEVACLDQISCVPSTYSNYNDHSSSTSDLGLLAEVAANRNELIN